MKVSVNDEELFSLEDWEIKVIENDICSEECHEDLCRRLEYILKHKVERCYERFEKEWLVKLQNDPSITSIPADKKAFVEMVMLRADYKNRSARDAETKSLKKK